MDLTTENKAMIDGLTLLELKQRWRRAPLTDKWLQGETEHYWLERMAKLERLSKLTVIK